MSKASDLRRKATEAVRAKDFDRAVELYEKVCAQDPSNGTPRNELGDVFLKLGDTERAIASLTEAARLYQEFGLTNNAVAVHKKILRHEPNHLHSLWVLGDIRREQGLDAEASAAFIEFLNRYESVTEAEREAFVTRGLQLIELMGDDPQILSALDSIFGQWDFGQERARVLVAKARLAHEEGEHEVRDKYIDHARSAFEHLEALPDYVDFQNFVDPASAEVPVVDVGDDAEDSTETGTIVIEDDDETRFDFTDDDAPVFDAPRAENFDEGGSPSSRVRLDSTDIDLGFDFDMDALDDATGTSGGGAIPSGVADSSLVEPVTEIEIQDEASEESVEHEPIEEPVAEQPVDEPIEEAVAESPVEPESSAGSAPEPGLVLGADDATADPAADETVAEEPAVDEAVPAEPVAEATADDAPEAEESVDLLEQILSDEAFDMHQSEQSQVDTIANEMQGVIGNDVDAGDYTGQYEVGMVYMDMALYDQAIGAFTLASEGDDERLRALEMKGTCLLRLERVEEALTVFQEGLAVPGYPGRAYLGLLYGVGAGHEAQGNLGAALEYLERVHAVDAAFLDVDERMTRLRAAVGGA